MTIRQQNTYSISSVGRILAQVVQAVNAGALALQDGVDATANEINVLHGVSAGTTTASKALVVGASKNVDELRVDTTFKLGATAVTATAAEINKLAGVTAGTSTASKVAVLGANKDLDELRIETTFKLGATTVSATAAELNKNAGVTAGTVAASKVLVVDANKALDVVRTASLRIGASGSEVTVGATAAEINLACDISANQVEYTASGAIPATVKHVQVAHATVVAAMTMAAPPGGGFWTLKNCSASGTVAHTVTLTGGTFNGTNTVLTTNAPGECIVVLFDTHGNGYVVANTGVALS